MDAANCIKFCRARKMPPYVRKERNKKCQLDITPRYVRLQETTTGWKP